MGELESELAGRRFEIGSSDIVAIAGLDPSRGPREVWLEKLGKARPPEEDANLRLRTAIKQVIADEYLRVTNEANNAYEQMTFDPSHTGSTSIWGRDRVLARQKGPWCCTPDRIVRSVMGGGGILLVRPLPYGLQVEIPPSRAQEDWGRSETGELPDSVVMQAQWSMHVTGMERWDVAAYIDGELRTYKTFCSYPIQDHLRETVLRFWSHCNEYGPPAAADRESTDKLLALLSGRS